MITHTCIRYVFIYTYTYTYIYAQVILDGVFNHTGRKFFAFKNLVELGDKWQNSAYKDWYFVKEGNSTYGDAFGYRSVSMCVCVRVCMYVQAYMCR